MKSFRFLFLYILFIFIIFEPSIFANTLIVDNTGTTLYSTISAAVTAASSGDTILLTAGQTFTGSGNNNLTINKDLIISRTGVGADPIIDMQSVSNQYFCTISSTVTLSNLEINNALRSSSNGGAINNSKNLYAFSCTFSGNEGKDGGAIYNSGNIYLNACIFQNCSATSSGGGALYNYGYMNLSDCIIKYCQTTGQGGAIYNDEAKVLYASSCIFLKNSGTTSGGAIRTKGTTTMVDCTFSGNSSPQGSGIHIYLYSSNNSCSLTGCTFTENTADNYGGAVNIYCSNPSLGTTITACTFIDNAAYTGGAIYSYVYGTNCVATVTCSRFVGNSAHSQANGNAIYADSSLVTATSNWWGSNTFNSSALFAGNVVYSPWITMALSADPVDITPGSQTTMTVSFSSACIPDGTPVTFSAVDGIITPTISFTVEGTCSASMATNFSPAQVCAVVDTQTLCESINTGYTRFNFGCVCSDTGDEHILIGPYNDPEGTDNQLRGCIFDSTTNTTEAIAPYGFGSYMLSSVAVYNHNDITYIALLKKQDENCFLQLATCSDTGSGFEFVVSDTVISLANPTVKVQWIIGTDGSAYIATDMQETMNIFKADLSTLNLELNDSVTNLAGNTSSNFLYWALQTTGLYIVQGYNDTTVTTYKVDQDTGTFLGAGVTTDASSIFSTIYACSTCDTYLVLGGRGALSSLATLASYSISDDGTLAFSSSATLDASEIYYCERCCCTNNNHLLVATDNGLYSVNQNTFDLIASNTNMPNNVWVNTCWCCDSLRNYCSAIDNKHLSYIFHETGSNLAKVIDL